MSDPSDDELRTQLMNMLLTADKAAVQGAIQTMQKMSKQSTELPKPLSEMNLLITVIEDLTMKGFISSAAHWRLPDLETSAKILGLQWTPNLVGRANEIEKACNHVTFEESCRKPLVFFDGIPGTGKTRLLQEAAHYLLALPGNKDIAVVAVTFNHQQNAIINNAIERKLVEFDVELPVTLRLMHSFMGSSKAWGIFATEALATVQSVVGSASLPISAILTYLAKHFHKTQVLLLMDETLRWLDINMDISRVQAMVSSACQACDSAGRAVLFTAMSTTFLNEEETESTRDIVPITLCLLSEEHSRMLTSCAIGTAITTLQQLTGLSAELIVSTLDALAVGALPRAAETLATECIRISDWQRTPATISSLVAKVYVSLSRKYNFPLQISRLAVLGIQKLGRSEVIPGRSDTAERAVLRGWLPKPLRSNGRVSVIIPPMLMLCSLRSADTSGDLRTAAYYFSSLLALSPRNLWEELVLRTLILRTHIEPLESVAEPKEMTKEAASQDATDSVPLSTSTQTKCANIPDAADLPSPLRPPGIPPTKSTACFPNLCPEVQERSVFAMFSGVRVHCCAPRYSVRRFSTLSNMVLQFSHKCPPKPSELLQNPTLLQHLFVSESSVEPGMDSLTFRWKGKGRAQEDLVAVGIQCKWSSTNVSTVLSTSDIAHAYGLFLGTMEGMGWHKDQCVLVFLVHRNVASTVFEGQYLVPTLPQNVAVAGLESGIEDWLGPTLTHWARCLHTARISHGPYGPYTSGQGPPT